MTPSLSIKLFLLNLKKFVAEHIRPNSILYRRLKQIYMCLPQDMRPREGKINQVIETFSKIKKDIFFIQIGSNDGIAGDPIHQYISEHNWSGILVEPIKYVFERLLHNYTGYPRLIFENVEYWNNG